MEADTQTLPSLLLQYSFQHTDLHHYLKQIAELQSQTFNPTVNNINELEQYDKKYTEVTNKLSESITLLNTVRQSIIKLLKDKKEKSIDTIIEQEEQSLKRTSSLTVSAPSVMSYQPKEDTLGLRIPKSIGVKNDTNPSWIINYSEIVQSNNTLKLTYTHNNNYKVYKVILRNMEVCMKSFKEQDINEEIYNECETMIKKESPFICKTYGICVEGNKFHVFREWMPNGSLVDYLVDNDQIVPQFKFSFLKKMNIAITVVEAIKFCINNGFTKPNINLSNILLDRNWNVKLADQSLRTILMEATSTPIPTFNTDQFILEFGKLLINLITGSTVQPLPLDTPSFSIPPKLRNLIDKCTKVNTSYRPSIIHLLDISLYDEMFKELYKICMNKMNAMWDFVRQNRNEVPWSEFVCGFCKMFNLVYDSKTEELYEFKCFAAALDCNTNKIVTYEALFRFIACIGPFIDITEVLDQAKQLIQAPWFFGALDCKKAEEIIKPMPEKSFLVRYSSSIGDFTITFKQNGKFLHCRVPENEKYSIQEYIQIVILENKFTQFPPSPFAYICNPNQETNFYLDWEFIK